VGRRRGSVLLAAVLALVLVPAAAGAVGGLNGPLFGLATAPNGDIMAADASTGVLGIRGDNVTSTWSLPAVTDVAPIGRGQAWATIGASVDPTQDDGQALYRVSNGNARMIVNLFDVEAELNPDGKDPLDSNPYAVLSLSGNEAVVVDAGANALYRADVRGNVEVMAVFPDALASTDNLKDLAGCPNPPVPDFGFVCGFPPQVPAEPVPTSVAQGADGWFYVGELKGFPAPTGESRIWRVAPDADWAECGSSPDCELVFDGGFTSIIDVAFGPDGRLYVAELDEASWAGLEIFGVMEGGTINACDVGTLVCEEVATGIPMLTAITFGNDGTLWATRNALIPGAAEVFAVN
jgi:hypothetical protein